MTVHTNVVTVSERRLREWPKQIAVWLGISALIPLTAWYATAAFHPPPDEAEFQRVIARYNDPSQAPAEAAAREKYMADKDRLQKQHDDALKSFYRVMFWVTYPIGLLAALIGLWIPIQSIGAGFMFGGIFALTAGCYSAWDEVGRWAHFFSLIIALAATVISAFYRFAAMSAVNPHSGQRSGVP